MPIKLEICSGTGEWAVQQAVYDQNKALWITAEVRLDRVYDTFTRSIFTGTHNLAVLGGDAFEIMDKYLQRGQVSHVFINHPEPPIQRSDYASLSTVASHLLTESFFKLIYHTLSSVDGRMTIVTDSLWYARLLHSTLSSSLMLKSCFKNAVGVSDKTNMMVMDTLNGIDLFMGEPDSAVGYNAASSSYFDRLKKSEKIIQGKSVTRYVLCLDKK